MTKTWIGTGSLCDPDLPINFIGSKGEMITFSTAYHSATEILYVGDQRHQRIG
jgi:hypothetical protein